MWLRMIPTYSTFFHESNSTTILPLGEARWLSGIALDYGAKGRGSKTTSAVLCP